MQIQLNSAAQSKLEQILDLLYMRYDLEELMPEQLVDSLISIGLELMESDDEKLATVRDRLIEYCSLKVGLRVDEEEAFHEEIDYRG